VAFKRETGLEGHYNDERLCSVGHKGADPSHHIAIFGEPRTDPEELNIIGSHGRPCQRPSSSRAGERNELATIDCMDDIVVHDEDSCLSRMVTMIRRLPGRQQAVLLKQVIAENRSNGIYISSVDDAATTMGLHTSWVKTKLQNIGYGPPPQPVSIDGHPVGVTDKFVYLGSTVDSTGYSNTDILRRIGLASSVMGQLDRVWRQNRLSLAILS